MIKQPWLAAFLSLLLPGAGQIYAGKRIGGATVISLCFCSYLAVIACFLGFLLSDNDEASRQFLAFAVASVFLPLLLAIYSCFDSYGAVKRHNVAFGIPVITGDKKPWLAVFLSHILPGIGQFYNKQVGKGILFIIANICLFSVTTLHYVLGFLMIPLYFFAVKDAFESAAKINGTAETFLKEESRLIRTFIVVMIVLGAIPFGKIVKTNVMQAFKTPSGSMLHTLEVGDHILVNKTGRAKASIRRGDIVVFKYPVDPGRDFVKRIVAIGGDTIEGKNKIIYINGDALSEAYTSHTDDKIRPGGSDPRDNFGPYIIPQNNFFVMGDNRDQSYDSRYWGYVPRENILGRAIKIYWSWDTVMGGVRWNRIGRAIRQ